MVDSILNSTKKALGLDESYTAFDVDILMYINAVFSTLNDLGVGPAEGFRIDDASTTWDSFLNDDLTMNDVKSYMVMRVRMMFDPPATSFAIAAFEKQIEEAAWRINVRREAKAWVLPVPELVVTPVTSVLDGGTE